MYDHDFVTIETNPQDGLMFSYINWRGVDHHYIVKPKRLAFGTYDEKGQPNDSPLAQPQWVLHADVTHRDGYSRAGPRTFRMSKIRYARAIAHG